MSITSTHDHDWAVDQLTAYSIGMLPEEQTLRLEEHLRECGDCRARLSPIKRESRADAGHFPASLIATWPRATRLLAGLERDLVESHLRSCDACRATLAFAGHDPVLASGPVTAPVVPAPRPATRRAWGWALGLSGVAAAAAWLLVVRPALSPRDARTWGTIGPLAQRTSDAGGFELALPASTPGAVALPEIVAGSAPLPVDVPLSAEGGLVLRVPPGLHSRSPAEGGRAVTLTVLRASRELAHRSCLLDEVGDVIGVRSQTRLPAGDYALVVSVASASGSEPAQVWSWLLRVR
jgi:hypothetical protein